jgi:hypothetical protein
MMLFSAQRAFNRPKYTHTFATFVKASTCAEADEQEYFESHTISWLAAKKQVCLFRLFPEPGFNFSLESTLQWAFSVQARISMWGPYQIKAELYDKALMQKARLESGAIQYKVVDVGYRHHSASSCIHGVCDIDRDRGPHLTWFRYGESASRSVAFFFLPWLIDPHQNHHWVSERLGLAKYPIIHRQLPIGYLDQEMARRARLEISPVPGVAS